MRKARKIFDRSGRLLFVVLILAFTFVFAMFQGGKVSWTIFYSIVPFAIYSILLFFYPLSGLAVKRSIQTPNVQKDGKLIVSISVKRKNRFPLLYTVMTEKWAEREVAVLAGGNLKQLFVFGFRKEVEWTYEIENMPRGEHILQGITIEVSDFFGWFRKTKFIEAKDTILVFPKMIDLHYIALDKEFDQGTMASLLNIVKDTTMATGVRGYQAGDRVTWIHWKSFARTQTLMTKEFEDRRSQELFLILDGRESALFEEQVELTASIVKEAARHQTGLTLMTTGPESSLFPFLNAEEQFHQALVHLAKIKPVGADNIKLLANFGNAFRNSGSIIVITSKPDWPFLQSVLRNAKNAASVICFTVVAQDDAALNIVENDIRLAKSKGIAVYSIRQEQFKDAFKEVARR